MPNDSPSTPDSPQPPRYTLRQLAVRLWNFAHPSRRKLFAASFLAIGSALCIAVLPLPLKYAIDNGIQKNQFSVLALAMVAYFAAHFINLTLWFLVERIMTPFREEVLFRMRTEGFRHLQRLCMRFHDQFPTGYLHDRVFEQSITRIGGVTRALAEFAANILVLLLSFGVCLWLSPLMTVVVLAGVVGYILVGRYFGRQIRERAREHAAAHNWVSGYILDRLRGTKTIQAYTLEQYSARDFEKQVWPVQVKCIQLALDQMALGFTTTGIATLLTAALYVIGGYLIIHGMGGAQPMTLGTLLAFMGYQGMLTTRVGAFIGYYGEIAAARAGFEQYLTIMDTKSTVVERPGAVLPATIAGAIEFRDVQFAYRENSPALRGVSFTVPANQMVALVGRSGSGKSTIASLLMRFYDPDAGQILLDGRPITELPLREYRAQFGIVLQDPYLFDDTIEMNLRCIQPTATTEDIRHALHLARALEFVDKFPEGLQHRVGESGGQLSGGQRQRIAIARCFLLKPKFLILDEATSALDTEAEALVHGALSQLTQNRTSFVIAHRLSTIRNANRLLVMDNGRVVEDGTFDELLTRKGTFFGLYQIATSTSARRIKLEEAGFA